MVARRYSVATKYINLTKEIAYPASPLGRIDGSAKKREAPANCGVLSGVTGFHYGLHIQDWVAQAASGRGR